MSASTKGSIESGLFWTHYSHCLTILFVNLVTFMVLKYFEQSNSKNLVLDACIVKKFYYVLLKEKSNFTIIIFPFIFFKFNSDKDFFYLEQN